MAVICLGCIPPRVAVAQDTPVLKSVAHVHLSCVAKVVSANVYGQGKARDSWVVECVVTDDVTEVWRRELASPIGMTRNEALHLIDRWLGEGAYDVLRTYGYDVRIKGRKKR